MHHLIEVGLHNSRNRSTTCVQEDLGGGLSYWAHVTPGTWDIQWMLGEVFKRIPGGAIEYMYQQYFLPNDSKKLVMSWVIEQSKLIFICRTTPLTCPFTFLIFAQSASGSLFLCRHGGVSPLLIDRLGKRCFDDVIAPLAWMCTLSMLINSIYKHW